VIFVFDPDFSTSALSEQRPANLRTGKQIGVNQSRSLLELDD
jgi:hypothetical protein